MNVVVLGATGFVGRHVVTSLLKRRHQVTAVARNSCSDYDWGNQVRFISADVYADDFDSECIANGADAVIDLVWPGLPNYRELFHFETNLPASYRMLKSLIEAGCRQVVVAGTCLEYGLQNGCLSVDMNACPQNPYAYAKDSLRRQLQLLQTTTEFTLQWARLFYVYGEGQSSGSLLPLLDRAIESGDTEFPMSGGEQLRDFLPVDTAAEQITRLLEQPHSSGIFNICSGQPMSVRRLVEDHARQKESSIKLQLGKYPYPDYEPMAFWGEPSPDLLSKN